MFPDFGNPGYASAGTCNGLSFLNAKMLATFAAVGRDHESRFCLGITAIGAIQQDGLGFVKTAKHLRDWSKSKARLENPARLNAGIVTNAANLVSKYFQESPPPSDGLSSDFFDEEDPDFGFPTVDDPIKVAPSSMASFPAATSP